MPAKESDRRRLKRVLTRNSEYYFRDDVCIAVRKRATGEWLDRHPALNLRVEGGIRFADGGSIKLHPRLPEIGDWMIFDGSDLLTAQIEDIGRPPAEIGRSLTR